MRNHLITTTAAAMGILLLANGFYMIFAPESWYWSVPGVPDRGPFNQHFVRDIGIVYSLTSVGLILGAFRPGQRAAYWWAPAVWLGGHALFHFWEVAVGICGPYALVLDFATVTLPAVLLTLMLFVTRNEPRRI